MNNLNSINNNGVPYYFPADIAKEGGQYVRISNFFKTRVGDNGKVLPFKWYDQGRVMNVHGFIPFIKGSVGKFSTDDNDEVIMSPDASYREWQGSTANAHDGGFMDYILEDQMFPQEGIFKGHFGLKDGNGNVLTSVNIIFEVLGTDLRVGETVKYYVGELENLKSQYKIQGEQAVADFNAKIEAGTETDRQALDALRASIQANRDGQDNLSRRLVETEQVIAEHDIVTRNEFLDLGNRLNQQVANLRQNKTLYFDNLADLKAKYPNGTDNLCITLDDKHLHVYDYANNNWTDAGITNVVTADPQTKQALYQDSSNLAPNPDFKIMDDEWTFGRDLGSPDWAFESETLDNSNVIQMHGYYNQSTINNWNNSWIMSRLINISGQSALSVAWKINSKTSGQPSDAHSELQINFNDENYNFINKLTYNVPESTNDELKLIKWENITPPTNAKYASISVMIHGSGIVRFAQPQINYGQNILPYDIRNVVEHVQPISSQLNSNNLVPNPNLYNLDTWSVGADLGETNYQFLNRKLNTSNVIRLNGINQNKNQWLTSDFFDVSGYSKISQSWMINIHLDNPGAGGVQMSFAFFDSNHSPLGQDQRNWIADNTNDFKLFKYEGISVPAGAKYAQIYVIIHDLGYIDLAYPQVNEGEQALPYSLTQTLSIYANEGENLVPNSKLIDLDGWIYGNDTQNCKVDILDETYNNHRIARLYGHNKDDKNPTDSGNAWLISPNFEVDNYSKLESSWLLDAHLDNIQDGYINISFTFNDANQKNIGEISIPALKGNNSFENFNQIINVPQNAVTANISVLIHGSGYIDITQPSVKVLEQKTNFINDIVADGGYFSFGKDLGGNVPYNFSNGVLSFSGFHSDQTENNYNNSWLIVGGLRPTKDSRFVSFDITMAAKFLQGTDDNFVRLEYYSLNSNSQPISGAVKVINISENVDQIHHVHWDGIGIPEDATTLQISIIMHNKGTVTLSNIEYMFNSTYDNSGLPKIFIRNSHDIDNTWQNAQFRFIDKSRTQDGYLQLAIQGDSSRSYPKKNFKTKFFKDDKFTQKLKWKPNAAWQSNNKFNFKANWIDTTQSRNLVNAQMIQKAAEITPMEKINLTDPLLTTQGLGQMEGFPVEVYLIDGYYGLFTLNTKKDDKTFGMDSDNHQHEVISIELADGVFRDPKATIDGKNYLTEIHGSPSPTLKANFEKFVNFVASSSPDDFMTHLGDYIDVNSCINTMLYGILSKEYDYYNKSYLLCTWNDGAYFYMVPYDLDSTWGLYWDGSKIMEDGSDPYFDFEGLIQDADRTSFISNKGQNRLFERIYKHFKSRVKKQWNYLRKNVWRNSDISEAFKKFISEIPQSAYEREQARWPTLPSKNITDYEQIQKFIIERGDKMDNFMDNYYFHETDPLEDIKNRLTKLEQK